MVRLIWSGLKSSFCPSKLFTGQSLLLIELFLPSILQFFAAPLIDEL
jgi:hypothetical protein